jgi:hypothetical protein
MAGSRAGRRVLASLAMAVMLAACSAGPTPTPAPTTPTSTTPTPTPPPTQTPYPTSTPDLALARQTATLYEQDFESGTALGLFDQSGNWSVSTDSTGNHVFCNEIAAVWQSFKFGSDSWTDYALEARVEFLAETPDQTAEVYARVNPSMDGYRASLYQQSASLTYYPPTTHLGGVSIGTEARTWYTLRVEAAGSHLRFFIDDRPIADDLDSRSSIGTAGFGVGPNTRACVDDIRLWALAPDGQIVSTSPRAKYEGDCEQCFVFDEGPLAPIGDPATAGFTYRPEDRREIVYLDENFRVPAGANRTFDNKIVIIRPLHRKNISIFGTLIVTNSLILWQQTDYQMTDLRIERGGTLVIKDSYSFSGNMYWVKWEYEEGSTIRFDHFIGDPVQTIRGSVDYSAINYSTVKLTLLEMTRDTTVAVSNAHEVWLEIFPPAGTFDLTMPAKRHWTDWSLSRLWPNTTIDLHDSYIYDDAISLSPDTHVTVRDTPGFGLGWMVYKDSPEYVDCELRGVGEPGLDRQIGKHYADKTWDLPCMNSSLTLKNARLEDMWPYAAGYVHLRIYDSNVADSAVGSLATMEIYDSSILELFADGGGRAYVENSQVFDVVNVRDPGSVVYGYGLSGPYTLQASDGGTCVALDKPGPPW